MIFTDQLVLCLLWALMGFLMGVMFQRRITTRVRKILLDIVIVLVGYQRGEQNGYGDPKGTLRDIRYILIMNKGKL